MVEHLRTAAGQLGLPFGTRTKTYNSRLAQELGLWAEDKGKGESFHKAAFHAYFADGLNLAKIEVLLDLVKQVGLDEKKAKEILLNRSYKEKVDSDWADSRDKAINAVPTFVMGQHKLVGAQNYETLVELVTYYGVARRQAQA